MNKNNLTLDLILTLLLQHILSIFFISQLYNHLNSTIQISHVKISSCIQESLNFSMCVYSSTDSNH